MATFAYHIALRVMSVCGNIVVPALLLNTKLACVSRMLHHGQSGIIHSQVHQSFRLNLQVTCAGGNVTGGKMNAGMRAETKGMLLQQFPVNCILMLLHKCHNCSFASSPVLTVNIAPVQLQSILALMPLQSDSLEYAVLHLALGIKAVCFLFKASCTCMCSTLQLQTAIARGYTCLT